MCKCTAWYYYVVWAANKMREAARRSTTMGQLAMPTHATITQYYVHQVECTCSCPGGNGNCKESEAVKENAGRLLTTTRPTVSQHSRAHGQQRKEGIHSLETA